MKEAMQEEIKIPSAATINFDAVVTDVQQYSHAGGKTVWRIALDQTQFHVAAFPTGRLIATARSGAELVAEILRVEADADGQIWHHTLKPLQAGTAVRGEVFP